jgi:hypothetical protein
MKEKMSNILHRKSRAAGEQMNVNGGHNETKKFPTSKHILHFEPGKQNENYAKIR